MHAFDVVSSPTVATILETWTSEIDLIQFDLIQFQSFNDCFIHWNLQRAMMTVFCPFLKLLFEIELHVL